MSTTQPIKNREDLEALKDFYLTKEPNLRNYALICTGINTALRISDILSMTWNHVYNYKANAFRHHIILRKQRQERKIVLPLIKEHYRAYPCIFKVFPILCPVNLFLMEKTFTLLFPEYKLFVLFDMPV